MSHFTMRLSSSICATAKKAMVLYAIPLVIAPCKADAATILAAIGDIGSPLTGATRVANLVASESWQTDFVLALGDNSGTNYAIGSDEWDEVIGQRYGKFIKKRSTADSPYPNQTSESQRFFPVVGDHDRDVATGSREGYLDYFHTNPGQTAGRLPSGVHDSTQSFYDFELPIIGGAGSIRVFAMDSESFAHSSESQQAQVNWLRDGLRSSTATWNFVTLHSPAYSSSLHNSNPLYQLPFQQWGADAVLSGHDHVYERLRVTDAGQNEMLYLVNGLGGSTIYPFTLNRAPGSEIRYNGDFGATRMTITDEEARFEFFTIDSFAEESSDAELIDSFVLRQDSLPAPPLIQADFNDDGLVDGHDLSIWRTSYHENDAGDASGDTISDGFDFLTWQRQRSAFRPDHPPSLHVVPEPTTTIVFSPLLAATLLLIRRRTMSTLGGSRGEFESKASSMGRQL